MEVVYELVTVSNSASVVVLVNVVVVDVTVIVVVPWKSVTVAATVVVVVVVENGRVATQEHASEIRAVGIVTRSISVMPKSRNTRWNGHRASFQDWGCNFKIPLFLGINLSGRECCGNTTLNNPTKNIPDVSISHGGCCSRMVSKDHQGFKLCIICARCTGARVNCTCRRIFDDIGRGCRFRFRRGYC